MEHNHEEHSSEHITVVEKKDRFLPISILIAAVLIGGAVVFATFYNKYTGIATTGAGGAGAAQGGTGTATTTNTAVMTLTSRDAILGNANAPVTMVEYGDYQCPYCGEEFFAQTEPQIVQNYVNTGKVRFVFRDFAFLGAESVAAANAAQCANDQGKMWPYHDALYTAKVADDQGGGSEDDGFFSTAELLKLGQQVSIPNMTTFTSCVQNQSDLAVVNQEKTDATNQGVDSTPTFYINGTQVLGAQPYAQFEQVINSALAAAQ
jgi:protein-disulfide isomerase